MLVTTPASKGFSLVELMVTIGVVAIMLAIATPNFREWMNNSRIRAGAESVQNGLRVARNEAAQRGTWVRLELPSASSASWKVCQLPTSTAACADSGATTIEQRGATEAQVTIAASTGSATQAASALATALAGGMPAGITFDALARPFGTTSLSRIDVAGANSPGRRLVILVSAGGMVRMCDPEPSLTVDNPQSCMSN